MIRVAFHLASLVSLLMLAACAVLWPLSYFRQDDLRFPPAARDPVVGSEQDGASQITLSSSKGRFQILRSQPDWEKAPRSGHVSGVPGELFSLTADRPVDRHWRVGGVEFFDRPRHSYKEGDSSFTLWAFRYLTVPYWLLAAVFALLPAVWVRRRRRRALVRYRLERGLCGGCGYDLRSSTGRCPECGAPAPAQDVSLRPVRETAQSRD